MASCVLQGFEQVGFSVLVSGATKPFQPGYSGA